MKQQNLEKNEAGEIKFRKPKSFEEVESPNFIKFEQIGDSVEGILIKKEESPSFGFGIYTILTEEKQQKRFHGSAQLDDLLLNLPVPTYIKIEFTDTLQTANGTMKVFKLFKGVN